MCPAWSRRPGVSPRSRRPESRERLAKLRHFVGFRASSLGDNQSLASFAAVNFDPKTDGAVSSFTIVTVSEPRVEPLKIKDLAKALDDALAADKEFTDRKRTYQDAHIDAIGRILKTENTIKKVSGPDAAVQREWTRWREETLASSKKVSDARSHLSNARSIPELSLSTPNSPAPDLSKADGQMESKDVAITATIRMPPRYAPRTMRSVPHMMPGTRWKISA